MALTTVPASLSATALTLTTAAQPNITSVGTLTGLTVSGNIAGTLTTAAQTNITSVGTLSSLTVSGALNGTLSTAAQPNITSLGTLTSLTVDDITINGSTISDGGTLTLDAASELHLDADDGIIRIRDAGGDYGMFQISNSDFIIRSMVGDKDLIFRGNDGGSVITALTLDMSAAGKAVFNAGADFHNVVDISAGTNLNLSVRQLAFDNFSNEGVGITFSRTSSDADLMAIGVVDTSKLNIASREGIIISTGGSVQYGATSEVMRIDGSGNVGIGTSNVDSKLHVSYTSSNSNPLVEANAGLNLEGSSSVRMLFGTDQASPYAGYIQASNTGSGFPLSLNPSGGNVGIGTTNPGHKLHIEGANNTEARVRVHNSASGQASLDLDNSEGYFRTFTDAGEYRIYDQTDGAYRLIIDTSGNVGIGTNNPAQKLDVQGTVMLEKARLSTNDGTTYWDLRRDSSTGHFVISDDGLGDTVTIKQDTGNVGIGTTNPAGLLTIRGTGDAIRVESTNTGAGGAQLDLLHHTTSPADNDVPGAVNFGGYYSGTTPAYSAAIRSLWKDVSARKGRFKVYTRNGSAFDTRLDITEDGVMINELDGKKFFKLTDVFTAAGSSTTNFKINVSDYTGASAGGYCHYTVSVMGYASGGVNGLNFKYSVAGYSGHNYSTSNYNSYGAGTIQNGASGSTQYNSQGLSYHPAVNLGGYIANGSVWVYVPAAQQYGVTVVNGHSTGMYCTLVVEGWST